jgi:hypothetical protein
MPTRFLPDAELAQLSGFPAEIADEDLVTYFTLVDADRRWPLDEHRGGGNQLGLGVQLCTLPWLGFVPNDLAAAPSPAVPPIGARTCAAPVRGGDAPSHQPRLRRRGRRHRISEDALVWTNTGISRNRPSETPTRPSSTTTTANPSPRSGVEGLECLVFLGQLTH